MFASPYWFLPRKGIFCWVWRAELQNKTGVSLWVFLTGSLCGAEMVVRPKLAFPSMRAWKKQWLWILQTLGLEVSKARSKQCLAPSISSLGTRRGWGILRFTSHCETMKQKSGSRDSIQTYPAV